MDNPIKVVFPLQEQPWISVEHEIGIKPIATGLSITAVVCLRTSKLSLEPQEFPFQNPQHLRLRVNGELVLVNLKATLKRPEIVIDGNFDFGIVSANSKVVSKSITLSNKGTKTGSFRIKYIGNSVKLSQLFGKIKPARSIQINAEFVTDSPKVINENVEITFAGQSAVRKEWISANVVARQIAVLDSYNNSTRLGF